MSTEKESITINLFEYDDPITKQSLQKRALERFNSIVEERVNELPNNEDVNEDTNSDLFYPRYHKAVLISGGRGSGKTTFLLKALIELKNNKKHKNSLCVLPMIDPTLIETKDHIVMVILQMIDEQLDQYNYGKQDIYSKGSYECLDQARVALAEGLALMDGIGSKEYYGSEWEDSAWVMSEGLRKAKRGRLFERKFNHYLECALKVIGKQLFVLAFDDVDTNFKRGYMILEALRKYFTSPRLFLVLSGDLDLYGRLVRKDIYCTFGSEVMEYDADTISNNKSRLSTAVLDLEEQYLLKVLPPQYRISMLPVGSLTQYYRIMIRPTDSSNAKELINWASGQIRKQLREKPSNQYHSFSSVVFSEHLRLVLGYLRGLELVDSDQTESRRSVLQVFETRLRAAGVPEFTLRDGSLNYVLYTIFGWIIERDEPFALITFNNPETSREAIVLHCLALALADGLVNGSSVLRALLTLALPAAMTKQPMFSEKEQIKKILKFLWRKEDAFLPDVAARISSISRLEDMRGRLRASVFGSVGVARSGSFASTKSAMERVYGVYSVKGKPRPTIAEIAENIAFNNSHYENVSAWLDLVKDKHGELRQPQNVAWFSIEKLLEEERCGAFGPLLSLVSLRQFSSSNEVQYSISAFSLIASIAELLALQTISREDILALSVNEVIPSFGSVKEAMFDNSISEQEEEEKDEDEGNEEDAKGDTSDDENDYQGFLNDLNEWLGFSHSLGDKSSISPSLLGVLANRLHDDLLDLDDSVLGVYKTGQILHRQITNILNAIVTVTSGYTGRRESPKSTDVALIRALNNIEPDQLHPLPVILLSCPLLWLFLKPSEEYEQGGDNSELSSSVIVEVLNDWFEKSIQLNWLESRPKIEEWIAVRTVTVKVGRIVKNTGGKGAVKTRGFYNLLNAVPRYAETSKNKQ